MLVNRNGQLGTFFKVNGEEYAVSAPGEFSVYNAVAAITVCRHYGIDQEIIRKALKTIRVPGRVEVIDNDRGYLLLIDYAHNAMSLKNILETIAPVSSETTVGSFWMRRRQISSKAQRDGLCGRKICRLYSDYIG